MYAASLLSCVLAALVLCPAPTASTAEFMSRVTAHFGQALDECREESGLTVDGAHHWGEEATPAMEQREFGCALVCMVRKFSLLRGDERLHRHNMDHYVRSLPDGELLLEKMVEMIRECERQHHAVEDACERILAISACFKRAARHEDLAPSMAMAWPHSTSTHRATFV